MKTFPLILAFAFASLTLSAQQREPGGYERILLPVWNGFPRQGATGSIWVTDLAVRNESAERLQIFEAECVFFCTCVLAGPPECGDQTTAPGSRFRPSFETIFSGNPANVGLFLYVPKRAVDLVSMNLRIRDASRSATSLGTEVPVVRSQDFHRTTPIRLLDVPVEDQYRQHLRLYGGSSSTGAGQLRVHIFDETTSAVLADLPIALTPAFLPRVNRDDSFQFPLMRRFRLFVPSCLVATRVQESEWRLFPRLLG